MPQDKEIKLGVASINNYSSFVDETSLLERSRPQTRIEKIKKVREYVWTNPLLYRIIKMKVDFASAGLEITHPNEEIEDFYKDIYEEIDIDTFVKNMAFEHEAIGEFYPLFSWKKGQPISATLLNPELITVKSALGKDFIYMKPSSDVTYLLNQDDPEIKKELKKVIPTEILGKWSKGREARLKDEYSNRYSNLKAPFEKYSHSPIEPVLSDLEIMKTLQEADYATAKKLKQLLLQVKVGSDKLNNGKPLKKSTLKQARELWNNPSQTMEVFTQWFMDAEYIIPDMEIFSNEKYESVIKRLIDWSGVSVMISEGGSFSQGFIKIKGLRQEVSSTRKVIEKALTDLNKKIAEKNNLKDGENLLIPDIQFSNTALRDDSEIRQIVQFLYKYGLLSGEDTLDAFDYTFDRQMRKKESEQEYSDIIKIDFEPSQGLLNHEENESTNNDNPKDNEQPRP